MHQKGRIFGFVLGGHIIQGSGVADFGNLKQGFLSMKMIKKSNFRVQGMFFQQLY